MQIIAETATAVAVQLPGIQSYIDAYYHLHQSAPPIACDPDVQGYVEPRRFLPMVSKGRWPYDYHFFETHAPALILGGSSLGAFLRSQAGKYSPGCTIEQADRLTSEVDQTADLVYQSNRALLRIAAYAGSGNPQVLYHSFGGDYEAPAFLELAAAHMEVTLPSTGHYHHHKLQP